MQSEGRDDTREETRRLWVVALVMVGLIGVLHFTPMKQWLWEAQELKAKIAGYGMTGRAVFVLGSIAGIAIGLPRLLLCALGGVLFGFVEGLLLSQCSGVLGAYGAFLLTRCWAPKAWVQRKLEGNETLRSILAKPSVATIFVARQLPVPGVVPNVLLGVLGTGHWTFLLGTFLGYLPSNIPVALAGSSVGKESLAKALTQVSMSMMALGVFSVLILWIRRRFKA